MNEEISVPKSWLENLLKLNDKVQKQLKEMPVAEYSTIFKTDISALIGYVSSAETILKYNKYMDNEKAHRQFEADREAEKTSIEECAHQCTETIDGLEICSDCNKVI
jgi:hypothetical protein